MKLLFTIILVFSFSHGNYSIYFSGLKLGEIKNFDTLQNNYLQADVTNTMAKFLLGKDKFIFFDEDFTLQKDEANIKYKKDKYAIIMILKKALSGNIKDEIIEIKKDKFIEVKFDENYKFKYTSKDRIKSDGFFVIKDNNLELLKDTKNNIEIVKN